MPDHLPLPVLHARQFGARRISAITDDALHRACGVRIAFTGRQGGVSTGAFRALNLGSRVGDNPASVAQNRAMLLEALGASQAALLVPRQVHGDVVVAAGSCDPVSLRQVRARLGNGADAVVVHTPGIAALLCFADCVPVIAVSPTGSFAVIHAGWRGVMNGIAAKAVRQLQALDQEKGCKVDAACYNVYLGPHICPSCFEVSPDVQDAFEQRYGRSCIPEARHVDLSAALATCLQEAGIQTARIACAQACTACDTDTYFSYRACDGVCGRQAAIAFL